MRTLILLIAAAILTILTLPSPAVPDDFGKNKVQYRYLDWSCLKAPRYTLYYHQDQGRLPELSCIWLDDVYRDLSYRFRFRHSTPVPVVLYESPALFEQTNIITELLPEEVGGFTEIFKNRVVIPHNGSLADLRHVLHHEFVHAFVFGMVYGGSILRAAGAQVPLWFNEGLAELLSSGWERQADMFMLDRMLNSTVPPPSPALDGYLAYKGGQSFLYYLHSTGTDSLFNRMLIEFKLTRSAEAAIERVYAKNMEELGKDWLRELRRIYWPEAGRRVNPETQASPVTAKERSRANVYPRASPDGKRIAFFSDRHDYTRIIITDTAGKELRRIGGEHSFGNSFESFRPMDGAIAWSPDGKQLAFVAKKGGKDEIRIVDAATARTRRTVRPPLTSTGGLDWSRDGNLLTFVGMSYGQTDIYLYNLASDELTVLVDTYESKDSPRFSPDGNKIIFATTDTAGLYSGPFSGVPRPTSDIAVYDIRDGGYRLLTETEWNDKQPAFSLDGSQFVFVSDRNGIDNLYIDSVDNPGKPRPLTDYTGKCANPDWAADGSAIVFDLFMNQSWNIWRLAKPLEKTLGDTALAPTVWARHEADTSIPFFKRAAVPAKDSVGVGDSVKAADGNAVRPYRSGDGKAGRRRGGIKDSEDARERPFAVDAPNDSIPPSERYTLRFTPDLVIFGLGVSTYSGASGQALATFSDIMGDHRVTLAGDLQVDIGDYAQIFASYEYLKRRVNMMAGGFYYKYYSYDGLGSRYFHDLETGGILGLSYPFSVFSRTDLNLSGRYIRREPLTGGTALERNALSASLGYSFDNILWGLTGPLAGIRASASTQLAPPLTFTDEAYISGDIDIRHYTHIFKRYVWANRLVLGASAGLGDSAHTARRYFLGGSENWFNYGVNAENYDKNIGYSYYSSLVSPLRGWNYFDITGDRALLMNTEFRFPFIREVSTVWPIPMQIKYINGALFFDAGYAWTGGDGDNNILPPKIAGGYGFGMRANLGIFVLRYDRGWPTDFRGGGGAPINYFSLGAEF
ncbi:MAG: BamA/TamA family outer membrane protein [Chitinispirillales bacterium]|jgi:Tol biopolymer transport system component|nr:BamA/TamA family outer membrane protein [Chitinispirillales bacterium]